MRGGLNVKLRPPFYIPITVKSVTVIFQGFFYNDENASKDGRRRRKNE
jgi:hypothetical protein